MPSIMAKPNYTFTIPSLAEDTPLDCRLYHPKPQSPRHNSGAIFAHPYAPLGGSQDDPVVLSITETLLKLGYIVVTFNFRGARESAGKTSWTGRAEMEDFASAVGVLGWYLRELRSGDETDPIRMLLGGYSFGSLILARLPPVSKILQRFEGAEPGGAAAEIVLRAGMLARRTRERHEGGVGSLVVGGEETDASQRRSSRDSRRSGDVVRELPMRIKSHMKRRSGTTPRDSGEHGRPTTASGSGNLGSVVQVTYLLISPVLFPLSSLLLPPGLPFSLALPTATSTKPSSDENLGVLSMRYPALMLFGSSDSFTSAKRLRAWAENLAEESSGRLQWQQIDGAGHFWREKDVLRTLQTRVTSWVQEEQITP